MAESVINLVTPMDNGVNGQCGFKNPFFLNGLRHSSKSWFNIKDHGVKKF